MMAGKLDRLIGKPEQESRTQDFAREMYARQRRALDEQVPALWKRFRTAIRTECEGNPKHLRLWVSPNTEVKLSV